MKPYSLDFRKKIVHTYFTEPVSQRKLANCFRVSLSFVEKLLKQFRETADLSPKPHGGGHPPLLNAQQLSLLATLVEENNDATLEELCALLKDRISILVSRATMGRMLQKLQLTRKKKALHASERDTPRVQLLRVEYWQKIRDIDPEDLVFVDESGVNLAMVRLYGRSPKGQRAIGARPQKRGHNVSMLQALSLKGPIAAINVFNSMDSLTFEAYIIQRVVPNLWPGACLVMDNSPIHNDSDKEIEKALEKVGAQLIRLPPYSPDFSPIENLWSKVKEVLKSIGARTYEGLEKAIDFAYEQVSLTDIRNWFTHCCYCTSPN